MSKIEKKYISESAQATQKISEDIIAAGIENKYFMFALYGDLGAGKTQFTKGAAKFLGVKNNVNSPTFLIMKKYKAAKVDFLYHFDCYRLQNSAEVLRLGFGDIIKERNSIIIIEWAEKIEDILPAHVLRISFEIKGETKRKILLHE